MDKHLRLGKVGSAAVTATLAVLVSAGPSLAATSVGISYAASYPFAPIGTGTGVSYHSGGGANAAMVGISSGSNLTTSPSGAIAGGMNSAAFTYRGVTGGKMSVTLRGSYAYRWSCTAVYPAQANGGVNVIVGLYDVTAGRRVGNVAFPQVFMLPCLTMYGKGLPTTAQVDTGDVLLPASYSTSFSGSGLVNGHSYRIIAGIAASVATTAGLVTTTLSIREQSLTGTATY